MKENWNASVGNVLTFCTYLFVVILTVDATESLALCAAFSRDYALRQTEVGCSAPFRNSKTTALESAHDDQAASHCSGRTVLSLFSSMYTICPHSVPIRKYSTSTGNRTLYSFYCFFIPWKYLYTTMRICVWENLYFTF